jgi:hypothetical protein
MAIRRKSLFNFVFHLLIQEPFSFSPRITSIGLIIDRGHVSLTGNTFFEGRVYGDGGAE